MRVHWKSFVEWQLLSLQRLDYRSLLTVCYPSFASPVYKRTIGIVMLPKRARSPNGPWQGMEFGNDVACWTCF